MAARISNRLITLCSLAIGSIYAAGYLVTEASASVVPNGTVTSISPQSGTNPSGKTPVSSGSQTGSATNSGPASTAPKGKTHQGKTSTAQKTQYKDGTFQGTGTNIYGTVSVALTVKSGRITAVNITQCTTHYPQSVIDPVLPQMVIAKQSWQVDILTGATASTIDFAQAVYNALQQAKL